jgi:mannosyltransferase
VGYGVALAALGLGNFFSLLIIPAHAVPLALWARRHREAARGVVVGWLAAVAVAVVLVSPVIVLGYAQRYQIQWIKPYGAKAMIRFTHLAGNPPEFFTVLAITACGLAASAAHGRTRLLADWPARLATLALPWLLLPGALLVVASLIHPVYDGRYIVFCIPALALLGGAALAALSHAIPVAPRGWSLAASALALIVLTGVSTQIAERGPTGHGYNIRRVDHVVARNARPGDALLNISYWPMSHGGGAERELEAAYPFGLARLHDISQDTAPAPSASLGGTFAPPPVIRQRLASVTRLWVASRNHSPARRVAFWSRRPAQFLHQYGFTEVSRWHFQGVWLWLYTRRQR